MIETEMLGLLLRRYADRALIAAEADEHVAAEVERLAGFRNRATTPSGNEICLDEPIVFGGAGSAADPAEHLLAAVGASLSVTLTAHAAMRAIPILDVRVALRAMMDGRAFFCPGEGQTGLVSLAITLSVRSDAEPSVLNTLIADAVAVAPVLRALKVEPHVEIHVERPG